MTKQLKRIERYFNSSPELIIGNHWFKEKQSYYLGYGGKLARLFGTKVTRIVGYTDYELPWEKQAFP
jgi:hypothetical protein